MFPLTLRESKGSPLTHQELDNNLLNLLIPAGAVFHFAMATCPSGYLVCDGSIISRSEYSRLFNAIGTTYGEGDGTTTFQLPDLQDIFIRGKSESREIGSYQDDAFQGHRHFNINQLSYVGGTCQSGDSVCVQSGDGLRRLLYSQSDNLFENNNGTPRTADETRPKNITLLPCIKY